jgi:protein SCO1/2
VRQIFAKGTLATVGALVLALSVATRATEPSHAMHMHQGADDATPGTVHITLPDTVLADQDGKALRFRTDAVAGRLVAINFIYTTCTTVCPLQSALFKSVQKQLGDRAGRDVVLVSVTVDPLRDTPLALRQFASRYGAGPGWKFLTGSTQAVEQTLKAFEVSMANFDDHPATTVVGDPQTGEWVRFFGFPSSEQIVTRLDALQAAREGARAQPAQPDSRASTGTRDPRAYFSDTELVTQDGRKVRFYSDVLKDRAVVVNVMFTSCNDACPLITRQLVQVQSELKDLFGSRVFFVSITSDPARDTPAAMKKFAQEQNADRPGWIFLTGTHANVYGVLERLGARPADVEDHITVLYVLDVDNKRMRRILPNLPPETIAEAVRLITTAEKRSAAVSSNVN